MANQYRSVLASGGASTGGDALPAEVLSGKTFTNDNGAQTGTMPNRGAISQSLSAGQSYTIPEGYHNGNGIVTADGGFLEAGEFIAQSGTGDLSSPATYTSGSPIISSGTAAYGAVAIVNLKTGNATVALTRSASGYVIMKGYKEGAAVKNVNTSGTTFTESFTDCDYVVISTNGGAATITITVTDN